MYIYVPFEYILPQNYEYVIKNVLIMYWPMHRYIYASC